MSTPPTTLVTAAAGKTGRNRESIDSELWQNTHDPDQIRHAQLPRIGVTSAVAR